MKVKVSLINSTLHESNNFSKSNIEYINSISKCLNEKITFTTNDDYDCDIKLIFVASGGSEGLFLENIDKLKEPYLLLTTGANNSLAASLEIMTYINNNNLTGEILHGSVEYIASRINDIYKNKLVRNNIETTNKEISYRLKETVKLGVIGKPSNWLIASIPNYNKIKENFNIELVDIPMDSIIEEYNARNNTNDKFAGANLLYEIINKIVKNNNLKGFTIRCFDFLNTIHMTACLALAKFNEEGIIGCCEGDIMAMITMYLVKKIANKSSFQANPSIIDVDKNEIVLAHCTCPLDMLTRYDYMTHFESKIGVAIKGYFKEEDVTIIRLSKNLKNIYIGEGKIIKNLEKEDLCRSQVLIKMDDSISPLLTNPSGNHHIILYGKYKNQFTKLLMK